MLCWATFWWWLVHSWWNSIRKSPTIKQTSRQKARSKVYKQTINTLYWLATEGAVSYIQSKMASSHQPQSHLSHLVSNSVPRHYLCTKPILRMPTFVLDTLFMSARSYKKLKSLMLGDVAAFCMHLCAFQSFRLKSQQRETSSWKDEKLQESCIKLAEGDLGGTWGGQHFGTSRVSRAPWWSTGRLSDAEASVHTGNRTASPSKESNVEVDSTWTSCESKVNVHIHIMYRHHDHLHSWVSGLKKILDVRISSSYPWAPFPFSSWLKKKKR